MPTPTIDPQLLRDIQSSEGCKLTAYRDTRGLWTIGYGHLLRQDIDWTGHTIAQAVADELLQQDIADALYKAEGESIWPDLDTDCRQNAVIELAFNMGEKHWEEFKQCWAAIKARNWLAASEQLLESAWAKEVGPTRSGRIAAYILRGTYSPPTAP